MTQYNTTHYKIRMQNKRNALQLIYTPPAPNPSHPPSRPTMHIYKCASGKFAHRYLKNSALSDDSTMHGHSMLSLVQQGHSGS